MNANPFKTNRTTEMIQEEWQDLDINVETYKTGTKVTGPHLREFVNQFEKATEILNLKYRINKEDMDKGVVRVWIDGQG